METNNELKISHAAICLKAIRDYIDMDVAIITKEEQGQLKEKAIKAAEHLTLFFNTEGENNPWGDCPARALPTI